MQNVMWILDLSDLTYIIGPEPGPSIFGIWALFADLSPICAVYV